MKIETIEIAPGEKRILLLMEQEQSSSPDKEVLTYLKANGIEAKKEYSEERDAKEYNEMTYSYTPLTQQKIDIV